MTGWNFKNFGVLVLVIVSINLLIWSTLSDDRIFGFSIELPEELRTVGGANRGTPVTDKTGVNFCSANCDNDTIDANNDGQASDEEIEQEAEKQVTEQQPTLTEEEKEKAVDEKKQEIKNEIKENTDPCQGLSGTQWFACKAGFPPDVTADDPMLCAIKTTTIILDENGNQIDEAQSPFYEGVRPTPTFSLVQTANQQSNLQGFDVVPKIKCKVFNNEKVRIRSAEFIIQIYADKLSVWNNKATPLNINSIILNPNNRDTEIGKQTVHATDLLKFLNEGEYNQWLEIKISGTIKLAFDSSPSKIYEVSVPMDAVVSWYEVHIQKEGVVVPPSPPKGCPSGQIFKDGVCVKETNPDTNGETKPTGNILADFMNCISQPVYGTTNCLASTQFYPLYFLGFGGLVVLSALSMGSDNRQRYYGVPY